MDDLIENLIAAAREVVRWYDEGDNSDLSAIASLADALETIDAQRRCDDARANERDRRDRERNEPHPDSARAGCLPGWFVPRFAFSEDCPEQPQCVWDGKGNSVVYESRNEKRPWTLYIQGKRRSSYLTAQDAMSRGTQLNGSLTEWAGRKG